MNGLPKSLTVFCDTNLFFECKALSTLPWSELASERVELVLSEPVRSEIDRHKNKNGRTGDRARKVFRSIRAMLEEGLSELEIVDGTPSVYYRLDTSTRPLAGLDDRIDYAKADDRLCAIAAAFGLASPDTPACLLTHDGNAGATAQMLGIPLRLIPETWLRARQASPEARQLRELNAELKRYQAAEPVFDCDAVETEPVDLRRTHAPPLSNEQLDALMKALEDANPLWSRPVPGDHDPPDEEAMTRYRQDTYPAWLETCRNTLASLHETLYRAAPVPTVRIDLSNKGSRPAEQVRVTFESQGSFVFRQPPDEDEEPEDTGPSQAQTDKAVSLPAPPAPPRPKPKPKPAIDIRLAGASEAGSSAHPGLDVAKWNAMSGLQRAVDALSSPGVQALLETQQRYDRLLNVGNLHDPLGLGTELGGTRIPGLMTDWERPSYISGVPSGPDLSRLSAMAGRNRSDDPETFYYENDWSRHDERSRGALTVQLWRHAQAAEAFTLVLRAQAGAEKDGRLLVRIDAGNLIDPYERAIRVLMAPVTVDTYRVALNLIADLRSNDDERRAND